MKTNTKNNLEFVITSHLEIPVEILEHKIKHYQDVFKDRFEDVFNLSKLNENEEIIILKKSEKIKGSCIIEKGIYDLKFRDFLILPKNRGKGYAKIFMQHLENLAIKHHQELIDADKKPDDINLMYLKSLVYMDSNNVEDARNPIFQFSHYLKRSGFSAFMYNKLELSDLEIKGIEVYQRQHPDLADRLKIFKKQVVDNGVELKPETKKELSSLDEKQWNIVMYGLKWKLGNYGKTGKVSYRYDLCPICDDVGSSEINSDNCKECYIHTTCMEPFRESGRFKENFEVSNVYFSEMRNFMLVDKSRREK